MANREVYDNLDPRITDERMGKISELRDDTDLEREHDMATEEMFDTKHGDGHTFNPSIAMRDGLTYTPPYDESPSPEELDEARTLPLDSEREPDPTDALLGDHPDNYDVEMQDRVYRVLRGIAACEPHVDELTVHIHNGYAILMGCIPADAHAAMVEAVRTVPGVEHVESRLR